MLLCFPPLTSDHTVCCSVHSLSVCLPHFVPSLQLDGQFGWRGMRSQRPRNSMPSTSCTWRSSAICLRNTRATMEWTRTHTWTLSKMNWHWSGCEWLFICKVLVLWVNCTFWLALQAQLYSQLFCLLKINKLSLIVQQDCFMKDSACMSEKPWSAKHWRKAKSGNAQCGLMQWCMNNMLYFWYVRILF